MPSLKARFLSWYIWYYRHGNWTSAEKINKRLKDGRATEDHRPPQNVIDNFNLEEEDYNGQKVFRMSPKSEEPVKARILYLHGGAFCFEITPEHWNFVAKLAEKLHAAVTVPIYPLGPETPLLKIYEAVQPLYNELAAEEASTPFWCTGDSAGGTMTLVLTQEALAAGLPIASKILPITPCVDATLKNPECHEVAKRDPWLAPEGVSELMRLITPGVSGDDPRVSPMNYDCDALPPMMVLAATHDLLYPGILLFADKCKKAGRDVELVVGEGMMHVWPILPIPEADPTTDQMVAWFQKS